MEFRDHRIKPGRPLSSPRNVPVELDVSDAASHCALGRAFRLLGNPKAAIAEFNTALRLNPSNVEAHYGLGGMLARTGSLNEGISFLQKAIDLSPQDPSLSSFHARMAETCALLGEDDKALDCSQQAMRLPNRTVSHHAALISELGQLGRTDGARAAIADLNAFGPGVTQPLMRELHAIQGDYMEHYFEGLGEAGLPE
jgi:tetratricopeptide (TPR) repeat protein